MGGIYLKGDLHGDVVKLVNLSAFSGLTKEDTLIILGDFGVIWKDKEETRKMLEFIGEELDFKLAFIDGNHENFKLIKEMETLGFWNDGCVGILPGGVLHLLRGEIYNINGKRVGVCGGANSVDKKWRVENESWWAEEEITDNDIKVFETNLGTNKKLDFMLSHTCPASMVALVGLYSSANGRAVKPHKSEEQLEKINQMANINKWYFGHWHIDLPFDDKYMCLYERVEHIM